MDKKVILMILDGWGIPTNPKVSAIDHAKTPFIDSLYTKYKHSKLDASGMAVGLPEGQMGNSEVGHMNLGAGRIVYQDLAKINMAVEKKTLKNEKVLTDALRYAKDKNKKVHFLGLVSDGGVHSHITHLKGLLTLCDDMGLSKVFVHAFTDGRDCDPKSGKGHIEDLRNHMKATTGQIASIIGRYYAMDRDKRWERVKLAYDVMVNGVGKKAIDPVLAVQESYDEDVTDEFIKPIVITQADGSPSGKIEANDVVIVFNFRTDRGREITEVLTQQDMPEHGMKTLPLYYVTMTNYDDTYKDVKVIFDKDNIVMTMGEVLQNAGKQQIRIAETEKYPHVTFFFSGGREEPFKNESRLMAPSPKVATYDLQPEMSAQIIVDKIVPELKKGDVDFVCLNFANPDMVGHTGVWEAAIKACETVDNCAEQVVKVAQEKGYATLIIADHGNSDKLINEDGSPNTAHTTNLVPCILVDNDNTRELKDGVLGNVAPTILELMGVAKPKEMECESLLK